MLVRRALRRAVLLVSFATVVVLGLSADPARAELVANPPSLDFGDVAMNTTSTGLSLFITNDESSPVTVFLGQSAGCNGRLGFSDATPTVPARFPPDDGLVVVAVTFSPNSRTALAGCTITVDRVAGNDPVVAVAGDSDAPQLSVGGDLAFGTVRWNITGAGATATKVLNLTNTGDAPLAFSNLTTSFSGTHATDFTVVPASETGFPIAAGNTGTITVQFNPAASGNRGAAVFDLELTNDPTGETVSNLNATGIGGQGILSFASSPLNIGNVPVNGTATATLGIRNRAVDGANLSLDLSSLQITGTHAADFGFTDHTCGGQSCLAPSPSSIAVNATENFAIACTPSASGLRTATLTVISNDASTGMPSSSRTVTLNCTGVPPTLGVSPSSVTFLTTTRVGTPATVQTVTLSNAVGAADLVYTAVTSSVPAEFPVVCVTHPGCNGVIPAGSTATFTVGFIPTAVGARTATVTVLTNDPDPSDATKVINLSGTGGVSTAGGAATLAFGDVDISTVGGTNRTYTLQNTGGVALNLGNLTITDATGSFQFNQTGCAGTVSCAGLPSIGPGSSRDLTLRCDPSTIGAKTATLTIPSDDPLTPKVVTLTCNGTTPDQENLDLPVATFPSTRVGTPSAAQTFRIRNNAGATTAPLVINSITSTSADFLVTCTPAPCARTVAAGTLVTVNVVFQPTATGPRTGTIAVRTNDLVDGTTDVPVSGTGVEPRITLTAPSGGTLTFADTRVNTASAAQTLTITNTGSMDLTINSVTNSNSTDFILTGPTGVSTVSAGMTLSWTVQCEPNTQGNRSGTITIANNSANQTSLPVSLTCSAIRGNLTVTSSTPFAYNSGANRIDFGATTLGQTRMTTVTIGNDGNRPVTIVAPTVTASQGFTLGAPSSMTVPAGGSITLAVTFMPTLVTHGTATVTMASDWNTLAFEVTGDGQDSGTIIALDPTCQDAITDFMFPTSVPFDATASQQFCYKNLGEAPAQITGIRLIDTSPGGPNFTVTGIPLVAPFPTLARDQFRTFTITAVPNDTMLGTFTATFEVTTTLPGLDAVKTLTVTYTSSGPGLTVGPAMTLDFGAVDVDAGPVVRPLTLQNTGTAPLPITNIAPGPTGRFAIAGTPPASIAVGATETIMVSYDPTVERSIATTESSTFTINTGRYFMGGVAQPTAVLISLTGYGVDQHIEVRGDGGQPVVAFGDVYRNPRADDPRARKTLQVCNTGEAPLRVTMTSGADAPFTVTGGDSLTIEGTAPPPGAAAVCRDVTVEFRPSDETYQPYSDIAVVMNDDDGRAMVDVMLTGRSIARPVVVPTGLIAPPGVLIAVGAETQLSEILAGMPGLTAQNVSAPSEGFAISIADGTGFAVVGDNDRELAAGETETYDLTITATQPGPVTVNVAVHLDGDPHPHATIPITVEAVEREREHLYGCAAGRGTRGGLAALALALALTLRRRARRP